MTKLRAVLLGSTAAAALLLGGCKKEAPSPVPVPNPTPAPRVHGAQPVAPPAGEAAAGETAAAKGPDALPQRPQGPTGTVAGTLTFEGTPPKAPPAPAPTDPACRGASTDEASVAVHEGKLANVLVRISDASVRAAGPHRPVVVHQQGCQYTPRVQGAVLGQQLAIQNGDPTLHNVHTYEDHRSLFNNAQPPGAPPILKPLPQKEGVVRVKCDVHPWMAAFVVVGHNPYFAVSDDAGHFEIPDVPPGSYTLEAWHETLGTQTVKVEVQAGQTAQVHFRFAAKQE
jgi:plastocyanin